MNISLSAEFDPAPILLIRFFVKMASVGREASMVKVRMFQQN